MAVLNQTDQLTALEITRRNKNEKERLIIEGMVQTNEILIDMPMIQANDGVIHNTVVRTSQPTGTKRRYNEGIGSSASTTKTVEDRIAMLEDFSVIDADLADHSGDVNGTRMLEAIAHTNGMGETQADDLVYGNHKADESEIDGFATRLYTLKDKNVISAGGSGNACSSIYIVACGAMFTHMIYPKGRGECGIKREDQGRVNWSKADLVDGVVVNKVMPAYVDYFSAHYGLARRHPDSIKRICNITAATAPADLIDLILEALWKLPKGNRNVALYANEDILCKIDKAGRSSGNVVQTREDPWGNPITHVREARCRTVNAILWTEAAVTAI